MSVTGSWERAARGAMLLGSDGQLRQTIFGEMSALAARTGAINLGQGFPDEDGPFEVLDAARQAITEGVNQYPPALGMPVLREAIAAHQERFYGIRVDPDRQVLVTAGATEALASTILALTDEGDEVLTLEPFYDAYGALIAFGKATHVTVPLRAPHFQPDHDDLRAAVTDRTRLILINSPHNPTGSVLPRDTLELLIELAYEHDAIIVTDEVYEHLTFGVEHIPISSLPGGFDRTVTISSAGKTFNTTGWKIGWIVAPEPLVQAILAVKQYLTFVNGAPFQPAIAVGLGLGDEFFSTAASTLEKKCGILSAGLRSAGFSVSTPQAGYFVIADAAALGVTDAAEFCRELPSLAGVAAVPVSAFVHPDRREGFETLLRFAFCKKVDVLERAAAQLASLSL
ncbi:aminotransferase class I/II-fold pyridoxal phosphate-dependent enzyme [Salinibacterium sp. G-O1]|uniref:aminotransferase class I/II-fold pyridoxal phosphate-dependent enzyme n=1 Tax=Salinibacterium sp. G-O1 TaxID=3046208 RepID=UPI0024BABAE4|nr:aminotransferase class I/II-fold pyridoxal phosphate-dependent enzyme [Salinibacterium sp. G-O1]MDJ0334527.1 aminotransferase class I/II-fold pyridoxal phosphate-dependent enzyme [Salinibacterium sp. G-O1]